MKKLFLLLCVFSLFIFSLYAKGNQEGSSTSANFYTGDGGKNISITIKVLTKEDLPPSLSNIGIMAYRRLIDNFGKYSDIAVRHDLDFDNSVYTEAYSGYYNDDDETGSDLGHLSMTDYLMTGTVTKSHLGYQLYLQVVKTAANDKNIAFMYDEDCTLSDLLDLSIVNRASLDLLKQMGIQLTEQAHLELLGTYAAVQAQGKTIMQEAITAQQAGDDARARVLLNQALELDVQLAEEVKRRLAEIDQPLVMLSTETIPSPVLLPPPLLEDFVATPELKPPPAAKTTGNIGNDARARQRAYEIEQENERIMKEIEAENAHIREENIQRQAAINAENARRQAEVEAENARRRAAIDAENAERDAHNREIWIKALADSEEYYKNYLVTIEPCELVYENKITEIPETQNFERKTLSLKFNAALVPVETGWTRAVENSINNLRLQLLAAGRAGAWKLASWPQVSIASSTPFVNRSNSIAATAELLNDTGKVIGSQSFSFDWNLVVNFIDHNLSISINEDELSSKSVIFENVNIDDITDTLQIRISKINGEDAEESASLGGVQYSTDYQRWTSLEQRKFRREVSKVRREKRQSANDRFLEKSGIHLTVYGGASFDVDFPMFVGGDIELRLFRWFGFQTGFYAKIFSDENSPVLNVPILAKINLMPADYLQREESSFLVSPFAGIDIDLSSSGQISPAFGVYFGSISKYLSLGFDLNYHKGVSSDKSVFSLGMKFGYYIPFRKL